MADAVTSDVLLGGRYQLLRQLARGGMATVWEAQDTVLGRKVAVKVLHAHLAADEALRERFRREAVAVARLSHPAIVAVYDTGEEGDVAYLVMELCEGQTLRQVMREQGALPVETVVRLGAEVASGLAAAHERGIIHRDVKPGNILVLADGRTKLTDFGIARGGEGSGLDEDLTQSGTIVGTAKYLAPEQVQGERTDARTDVYSLGLVLYEMLTGKAPYDGDSEVATAMSRLHRDPLPPRQLRADIPRPLEAVVMKAVAREPEHRHQSAAELRNALLALDVGPGDDTPEAGIAIPQREHRRFTAGVLGVVVVAVLVTAAGLFLAATDTGRSVFDRFGAEDTARIAVTGAGDFDPEGDGVENPGEVGAVFDGNRGTVWATDTYHDGAAAFPALKSGVGVRIDLGAEHAVQTVTVHTRGGTWEGAIYGGDGAATSLAAWGEPLATGAELGSRASFDLGGAAARSLLVWITRLPETGRLEVAEVSVAG